MMREKKLIIKAFLFSLVLFFGMFAQQSQAVEYGMIGGKPANPNPEIENSESWFIYALKSGEVKDDSVLVMNLFEEANDLVVYAADTTPSSSGGFALKQFSEPKTEVGSWVTFYPSAVPEKFQTVFENKNKSISQLCSLNKDDLQKEFGKVELEDADYEGLSKWCAGEQSVDLKIEAKGKTEIPFVIRIPENAEIGEHTGGILIQKKAVEDKQVNQGSSVKLTTRVGVRIYQTVPGEAVRKLSLADFRIVKNFSEFSFVDWFGANKKPKEFLIESVIKNEGNVSISHDNNLTIKNLLTGKEEKFDREFQVLRGDEFIANYSWKKPLLGYFSFVSRISYDTPDGEQVFSSQVLKKIVMPWRELTLFVILGGLAFLGYWIWRRNYKKKYGAIGWAEYTVKKTDTIAKLSEKHEIDWQILVRSNKLKPPFLLEAGMTILLPPSKDSKKTVAKITSEKIVEKVSEKKSAKKVGTAVETIVKTKSAVKMAPKAVLVAEEKKIFNWKYLAWGLAVLASVVVIVAIIILVVKNSKTAEIKTQVSISSLGESSEKLEQDVPIEKPIEKVAEAAVKKENGDISILNGGSAPGTAGKLSEFLKSEGFEVIETKNAELDTHEGVVVYYQDEYEPFAKKVLEDLSVKYKDAKLEIAKDDEQKGASIVIILGK